MQTALTLLENKPANEAVTSSDFFGHTRGQLASLLESTFGISPYRATQLFDWVYRKRITDFESMSNLGKELRSALKQHFSFSQATMRERMISKDGSRKYLFDVGSGICVESVMIKQPKRTTLCVSSQYGCGMGCTFCRTGTMGFQGNLSAGDIVRQVWAVIEDAKNFGDKFDNIVFMGMGEPLHNYASVTTAIQILTDQFGFGIAPRKITVSTVGLVPAIKRFAKAELGVNLAVSLNATTDQVRSKIMPVNKAFPLNSLLEALRAFPLKGRRLLTIEYVMLAGVNDTLDDCERLASLLKGMRVKVNLIPYNQNPGLPFQSSSRETVRDWLDRLTKQGLRTTIRWSKGADISAACGQLAAA